MSILSAAQQQMNCSQKEVQKPHKLKENLKKNTLRLTKLLRTWKLLLMMKYLESSSAGEIKTCISNIRISLNFWESLKRNTLFVKHQQPFLFLIFCVKLLLSFLESDETNEIKLETRCFSSLRLTDYRRRAPISLLWETPPSIKSIMRIKEKIVKPKS